VADTSAATVALKVPWGALVDGSNPS